MKKYALLLLNCFNVDYIICCAHSCSSINIPWFVFTEYTYLEFAWTDFEMWNANTIALCIIDMQHLMPLLMLKKS